MIVIVTTLDGKEHRHIGVERTKQEGLMFAIKTDYSLFRYPIATIKLIEEFNSEDVRKPA